MTFTGHNDDGTWLYGLGLGYEKPCWVNASYIKLEGNISDLEPVYPGKVLLPLFSHPSFPPVSDVEAVRNGDQVHVTWVGYELPPGDRESANSPVYLVEAWVCQAGKIVFMPIGAYTESVLLTDEAGCAEPSHGHVFVSHKDGYIGPVEIPWPAYSKQ